MKKKVKKIIIFVVFVVFITGCSSSKNEYSTNTSMQESEAFAYDQKVVVEEISMDSASNHSIIIEDGSYFPSTGEKMIITSNIEMETLNYEETLTEVIDYVDGLGGYIAKSETTGKSLYRYSTRTAFYTFRIPSDKFIAFSRTIEGIGNVLSTNTQGEDVSDQYYDSEARIKTLALQEERLLDILSRTEVLTDIVELERSLSEVRYEIESHQGRLRKWDNQIDYSTVNLYIYEVYEPSKTVEPTPLTVMDKMGSGLKQSLSNLLTFAINLLVSLVTGIPYIIVGAIVFIPSIVIARRYFRKKQSSRMGHDAVSIDDKEKLDV